MKKTIIFFIIAKLSIDFFSAQASTIDGLASFSAPSAASISNVVNSPVSPATGIPDISFPFFSLSTYNEQISVGAGIMYHPGNSGQYGNGTDVGLGWSLFGMSGSIYRQVHGNSPDSEAVGGDDMYYYNFLGRSGKFSILNTTSGQPPVLQKITLDKLDISFTNNLGVLKFKIVDEKGNSFFFDIPDKSYWEDTNKEFTSVYYLSKVINANNLEVLSFEYLEDNYTIPTPSYYPYSKPIKSLKLKKVNSPGYGSIVLTYNFDQNLRKSFNDPFQLSTIELKDNYNHTINKYGFEQDFLSLYYPSSVCNQQETLSKRRLKKLIKYDRSNGSEATRFFYKTDEFESPWSYPTCGCLLDSDNPKYLGLGLLNKIIFPTGGETRYEYEPNKYYVNKNTTNYLTDNAPPYLVKDREAQYYEDIASIHFDTHNANLYQFTIPNDLQDNYLEVCLNVDSYYSPCESPDSPYECSSPTTVNVDMQSGTMMPSGYKKYAPGHNSFKIMGTGGAGTVTIKRVRYKSLPIANFSTGYGVRIKNITYYDNGNQINGLTKNYSYDKFSENLTSGILNMRDFDDVSVIYKNVKETVGTSNGYTKYYFKTLEDYPENVKPDGTLEYSNLKYYNILNDGLMDKVEVYNNSNNMVTSESNTYEFYELPGSYSLFNGTSMKNAVIKKQTSISTTYTESGNITQTKELTRDTKDLNVINRKTFDSEGIVTEENITYPWGIATTDPKLWNAHIIDIPLVSEVKNNGILVSKTETKFNNPNIILPTSVVATNVNDGSTRSTTIDQYDNKGNVIQSTSSAGISTVIIYGYDQTLPIARISGVTYAQISSIIQPIIDASNADAQSSSNETALLTALDNFRKNTALQNAQVTTYTYDPLIGVTSSTSSEGIREIYHYDANNRLQKIVDMNGVTLKEYQYNYKN